MRRWTPAALVLFGCLGTTHLPPPPTPAKVAPYLAAGPGPGPTLGRLVVSSPDGPVDVSEIDAYAFVIGTTLGSAAGDVSEERVLCRAPCTLDLPPGPHELRLVLGDDRQSRHFVNVMGGATTFYAASVGYENDRRWRAALAWPAGLLGLFLGAAGAWGFSDDRPATSAGLLGTGLGLAALGVWLFATSDHVVQAGSGVQWNADATASVTP